MAERREDTPLLTVRLGRETDFLLARQRAAQIAALLGMERQDQTRVATAVSEIARNAYLYAGGGTAAFSVERLPRLALRVHIRDEGPGIPQLEAIWAGTFRSTSGMGLGILGAKRILDEFDIQSGPTGTTVTLVKYVPRQATANAPDDSEIARSLATGGVADPAGVLAEQNQELLQLLDALRARETELHRLNSELAETNRGVMVLYSELEDKAQAVQQANEMKSHFLSSVTHELRTPLNSVVSLSRLLLQQEDGDLSTEQEKQVGFILRSAQNMTEMVSDLLDLAKVEAGKITIKPGHVLVADVFSALRGLFRPMVLHDKVDLRFEQTDLSLEIETDEGKLAQVLRNLISNGLKFTDTGEVVVRVWQEDAFLTFSVSDTGIGIAPEHRELVFQEWGQVGSANAKGQRGSGLGLPLAKRFTELLGGEMWFTSQLGRGSQFFVRLPMGDVQPQIPAKLKAGEGSILIVDDDEVWRYLLRRRLEELTMAHILEAENGKAGLALARAYRPALLVIDLVMPDLSGLDLIGELRQQPDTAEPKALIVTSKVLSETERQLCRELGVEVMGKKDTLHDELKVALERTLLDIGLLNLHEGGA